MTALPESMHHREADGIKHGVWGIEVVEQHDEEAVVGQLVELHGLGLVVLQEHVGNCHQHLCGGGIFSVVTYNSSSIFSEVACSTTMCLTYSPY